MGKDVFLFPFLFNHVNVCLCTNNQLKEVQPGGGNPSVHGKNPFKCGQGPKRKRQERQDNQEDVEVTEKTDVGIARTEAEGVSGTQRQKKTHSE